VHDATMSTELYIINLLTLVNKNITVHCLFMLVQRALTNVKLTLTQIYNFFLFLIHVNQCG